MKRFFLLSLFCALLSVGAWGAEQTATLTFTAACGGSGTDDKGNSWTVTSDADESAYDGTKGIHYGTGKAAVSYLTLSNSSISGTITKIVVNASGASGTSAKLDVKVGGSAFGSQQSLTSSNAAYTFNGSATDPIEVTLSQTSATKALYVKSIAVTYTSAVDNRTAVNMTGFSATETTLVKGGNTTTTVTNDQNGWTAAYTYESNNTSVATVSNTGVITAVAKGTAKITATLNIENDDANWKKGATASKTIDITVNNPSHNYTFYSNGTQVSTGSCEEGTAITFPTNNPSIDDVVFIGWATAAIDGTQDAAPDMVKNATMGTEDVTYYAVFATAGNGGTQWKKVAASAVNSAGVYAIITTDGHAFNGSISSGHGQITSTAFSFDANGVATSAPEGTCEITFAAVTGGYTMYNAGNGYLYASAASSGKLAWHNTESSYWLYKSSNWLYNSNSAYLRDYQNSSIRTYGANNGSVIQFAKKEDATTYSDYCTTVSLDPKPTIVLSATELAEYAGNTNTSITANVSETEYTGALTVESSAEAVATASISEGTITIKALTVGSATITVTAPSVTGYRKNTATIAVTVSEKLAHGLSFSADALNLTIGATDITEPTLNNPNNLPVEYSLVYATPANEGKVATISLETGKITLTGLSTETQGAVTVKAHTDGDGSHAAGDVTYDLVVARKVTTTSWSNEGAAVTIDKDEIATLPTASNDGERNIQYESSNAEVASIDNTGTVTFVDYGTTTITAKTSATDEYAATEASYELTFAPRYTVIFSINGEETELREETSGAGVTAPEVEAINDKVFRGWVEGEIEGTTNDAPALVDVSALSLDDDMTFYAVFATENGTSLDYSMTIGYNGLSTSGYGTENKSATAICSTDPSKTLTIDYSTKDVMNQSSKIQFKASSGLLYNTTDLGSITSVTLNSAGGGVTTTYYGQSQNPTSSTSVGSNNGYFAIKAGSSYGTCSSITVTFKKGSYTYSDYCTTVSAPKTGSFTLTDVNGTGWSTYYTDFAYVMPANVEGKIMEYNTDKDQYEATTAFEAGDVVPAETALLLKGTAGNYNLAETATAADEDYAKYVAEFNLLKGTVEAAETTGGDVYYMFSKDSRYGLGWFYGAEDGAAFTCGAHKAYLALKNRALAPARILLQTEDTTIATDLESVETEKAVKFFENGTLYIQKNGHVYNAMGQLVK